MKNIKTTINWQNSTQYQPKKNNIREIISHFLATNQLGGRIELGISIVGQKKIQKLNKTYRNTNRVTDVLSFPQSNRQNLPLINLGDIIICYQEVVKSYYQQTNFLNLSAKEQKRQIDGKILQLVKHGLKHLLGIHHK